MVAQLPEASLFHTERSPRAKLGPLVYLPAQYRRHQVISERKSPPVFKRQKRIDFNTPPSCTLCLVRLLPECPLKPNAIRSSQVTACFLLDCYSKWRPFPSGLPELLHGSSSWAGEHHWGFLLWDSEFKPCVQRPKSAVTKYSLRSWFPHLNSKEPPHLT